MLKLFASLALVILMATGAAAAPKVILALGDSLTAGLGLGPSDAFPARLEAALKAKGHDVKVINAGVSGDTAADGAARLDWALSEPVDAVIVELGANDALRGLPVAQAEQALDGLLTALDRKNLPVLLAGMKAPPNMGAEYQSHFDGMYQRLAAKHPEVLLYPFFLDGVAAELKLNQGDGMHPNPAGVDVIVARILPSVEQLLGKAGGN
ncbi:MAG: arylesterase [Aestuariivirga sp.]|uniref:arylesterase n=1 Tax=Aestuariivirga sp. TaxID=2650926 RepID=UPI0025C2351E|nr:arylesterase [Aestuariivirga sp.]MCA3561742.1 arylesterase [Aestuariivirga sp.]